MLKDMWGGFQSGCCTGFPTPCNKDVLECDTGDQFQLGSMDLLWLHVCGDEQDPTLFTEECEIGFVEPRSPLPGCPDHNDLVGEDCAGVGFSGATLAQVHESIEPQLQRPAAGVAAPVMTSAVAATDEAAVGLAAAVATAAAPAVEALAKPVVVPEASVPKVSVHPPPELPPSSPSSAPSLGSFAAAAAATAAPPLVEEEDKEEEGEEGEDEDARPRPSPPPAAGGKASPPGRPPQPMEECDEEEEQASPAMEEEGGPPAEAGEETELPPGLRRPPAAGKEPPPRRPPPLVGEAEHTPSGGNHLAAMGSPPQPWGATVGTPSPASVRALEPPPQRVGPVGGAVTKESSPKSKIGIQLLRLRDKLLDEQPMEAMFFFYNAGAFLSLAAPDGQSWGDYCAPVPPALDSEGRLVGRWAECVHAAVVFENSHPRWEELAEYEDAGPAKQVAHFLDACGHGDCGRALNSVEKDARQRLRASDESGISSSRSSSTARSRASSVVSSRQSERA